MADIGVALKTHLKTISDITGMVGTLSNARIYEDEAKQGVETPYIVFEVFGGVSNEWINGVSGVNRNRVQIDCYGDTRSNAYTLAEYVRGYLQMYRGDLGGVFCNGITSNGTYTKGRDRPTKGSNALRHWFSRDFFITYTSSTAYLDGVYGPAYADQYG